MLKDSSVAFGTRAGGLCDTFYCSRLFWFGRGRRDMRGSESSRGRSRCRCARRSRGCGGAEFAAAGIGVGADGRGVAASRSSSTRAAWCGSVPTRKSGLSDYSRLSTGQRVTLLSLDRGLAYVTGQPEGRDALAVAVPGAQVTFTRGGRVRLEVEEQWSQIAVLRGAARFSSPAAELELREGQTTRVEPANAARFFFYREVLPLEIDKWSEERDDALASSPSAAHTVQRYGLADLDAAGEWIVTQDLGVVWRPKVEEDWRPFQKGRWRWLDGLGYTWISDEPWGWLPYHYGRWTRLDNLGWVWAPSKNGIFKPGDAYWVRGAGVSGMGAARAGRAMGSVGSGQSAPAAISECQHDLCRMAGQCGVDRSGGLHSAAEGSAEGSGVSVGDALAAVCRGEARCRASAGECGDAAGQAGCGRGDGGHGRARARAAAVGGAARAAPRRDHHAGAAPQPPPDPEVIAVPVPVPAGILYLPARRRLRRQPQRNAAKPATAANGAAVAGSAVTATTHRERGGRPRREEVPECERSQRW